MGTGATAVYNNSWESFTDLEQITRQELAVSGVCAVSTKQETVTLPMVTSPLWKERGVKWSHIQPQDSRRSITNI